MFYNTQNINFFVATFILFFKIHTLGKWLLLNCATYILSSSGGTPSGSSANNTTNSTSSSKSTTGSNNNNSNNNSDLVEHLKNAKLFMNQNHELCAASQFINPLIKDRYIEILDPKCLPAKDLLADEKCMNILKELKV